MGILTFLHWLPVRRQREPAEEVAEEVAEEEDEEQETSFHAIEALEKCSITVADVGKLKLAGFHTIESVLMATKKVELSGSWYSNLTHWLQTLCNVKGMSEAKIDKIVGACRSLLVQVHFALALNKLFWLIAAGVLFI